MQEHMNDKNTELTVSLRQTKEVIAHASRVYAIPPNDVRSRDNKLRAPTNGQRAPPVDFQAEVTSLFLSLLKGAAIVATTNAARSILNSHGRCPKLPKAARAHVHL